MLITSLLISLFLAGLIYLIVWFIRPIISHFIALRYPSVAQPVCFVSSSTSNTVIREHKSSSNNIMGNDQVYDSFLTSDTGTVDLSVIIPTCNQESKLSIMLDDVLSFLSNRSMRFPDYEYEVIIIDNASTDNTKTAVLRFANKYSENNVRLFRLNSKCGYGTSMQKGIMKSRGKYIVVADANGAVPFSDIERLERGMKSIETRKQGEGLVIGSRAYMEMSSKTNEMNSNNKMFRVFFQLCCVSDIYDPLCGFKLFTRRSARRLFSNQHIQSMGFDCEILYLAKLFDIPVKEEAVNWSPLDGYYVTFRGQMDLIRDILVMRFCYALGIWNPIFE